MALPLLLRCGLLVWIGLTLGGAAQAAPLKVGLLPIVLGDNIAPAAREQIHRAIVDALQQSLTGVELLLPSAVVAELNSKDPRLATCQASSCLPAVGQALGSWTAIVAEAREELGTYTTTFMAMDAQPGQKLIEKTASCEICTLEEAVTSLQQAAREFGGELSRQAAAAARPAPPPPPAPTRIRVTVTSTPAGGLLTVSGQNAGATPFDALFKPGEYRFTVTKEGYFPAERLITVGQAPLVMDFRLKPLPQPEPVAPPLAPPTVASPSPTATPPRAAAPPQPEPTAPPPIPLAPRPTEPEGVQLDVLAYIGLGLGLASTGLGAFLLGMDGEPTCSGPLESCPELWNTQVPGMIVTGLGAGLLVASAVLFVLDSNEHPDAASHAADAAPAPRIALLPLWTADGPGVMLGVQFW